MKRLFRFIYLNTYGFLFLLLGIAVLLLTLHRMLNFLSVLQVAVALGCFAFGFMLLNRSDDKYREYEILMNRNKDKFRPDTFIIYMDAPCGRKVVHAVLKDLGMAHEYRNLKKEFRKNAIAKKSF